MENTEYLKRLKSQLRIMDRKSRKDVLNEIQSSIDDDPNTKLEDRFGSVYQLAAQYLEDIPHRATWWQRVGVGFKWLFLALGVLMAILILLIFWFVNMVVKGGDEFNYTDINAAELSQMDWRTLDISPTIIDIYQSKIVIYTGEFDQVSYSCANTDLGETFEKTETTLTIKQNECFLRIPNTVTTLNAKQSSMILGTIQDDLNIDLWQAELLLPAPEAVTIENEMEQCKLAATNGKGGTHKLSLTGLWCSVQDYEYNPS